MKENIRSNKEKLAINIVTSAVGKLVTLICGLIVPRLILQRFGSEYSGILGAATQFMNYATILTIGIAGPTRVALYNSLAAGDDEKTSGILKATDIYMKKFSLVILAYTLVVMLVLPRVAHTTLSSQDVALLVAIVGFLMFIEYFFSTARCTLLRSDQREYITDIAIILCTIINCLVVLVLIKLGKDIFTVKFCSSLVFLLKPLLVELYIRGHYKIDRKAHPDTCALKERGAAAASSIANIVHDNVDLVLLSFFVDIKLVSVYTIYNLVIQQLKFFMEIFTGSLEAGFGNIIARKDSQALRRNFKIYEFLIYAFVSVIFSCAFVLIVPFVRNYTSGVTDINYVIPSFAFLMVLNGATYCIRQPYVTLVNAAGKYKETSRGAIIEAALNLVLSVILLWAIGFEGVVIGTIVANIFRSVQYCVYAYSNLIDLKFSSAVKKVLWCILNTVVICGLSELLLGRISATVASGVASGACGFSGWGLWILEGFITFLVALVVTLLTALFFFREELGNVKKFLGKERKSK